MGIKKELIITVIVLCLFITGGFIFSKTDKIDTYEQKEINLTLNVYVNNIGSAPALNVPLRLALPTNQNEYQIVKNINFSKEPEKITEDIIGNKFAHYTIEQVDPFSSINFTINISLLMKATDFNIQKDDIKNYDEDVNKFILESSMINYREPEIQNIANIISQNSSNIVDIAWNSYEWVIDNINYQQIAGENDALTTLKNREGGSAELGNLYVALLRANGIPARRVSGWGKNFQLGEEYHLAKFAHGWAEFYLPDYGWVPVDPTWGQNKKFDYFAKTYPSHIVMTKGSDIHFLKRGLFTKPYGDTTIKTDYVVKVNSYQTQNLSYKRTIMYNLLFLGPLFFVLFLISQKRRQRKIYEKA
ncbi:MAG: transglutaminase-like domain-containing protein [Candidatus Woesearchaeota archaeon]|jgi:transglutaminase-like putative cysteine protease|nr:transglutaminase-like domain-containing protein [Candidatus Woesearchaeota archaeon]